MVSGSAAPLYGFSDLRACACAFAIAGIRHHCSENRERLGDIRNTVIAANHAEPPRSARHLPRPAGSDLVALAKREVFDIPLFSTVIRRAGFISIQRGDRQDAANAVDTDDGGAARGRLRDGLPRGDAVPDRGAPAPSRKATFVAAIEAESRIVPIAVFGHRRRSCPGTATPCGPGVVRIAVLESVEAGLYSYAERDGLVAEVRGRIAAALEAGRGGAGGERSVA